MCMVRPRPRNEAELERTHLLLPAVIQPALRPGGAPDDSDELPHHLLAVIVLDGVCDAAFDVVL